MGKINWHTQVYVQRGVTAFGEERFVKIAVVGSGIAGISAAWLLSQRHEVDVFEAEPQLGGHTKTIDVSAGGLTFPVDTGFMVFNRRTYPNLTRFFEHLGVTAVDADMSFSVSIDEDDIEWSGTNLDTVFARLCCKNREA